MNRLFFQLLRAGLGLPVSQPDVREAAPDVAVDGWEGIYKLGVEQGVAAIQLDGLQALMEQGAIADNLLPERAVKLRFLGHALQVERQCEAQRRTAAELAAIYAQEGIRTVVLKGIAAGQNYPRPDHRPCGDLDCFLFEQFETGNRVAEAHGARVKRDFYKHSEILYKGLMVENHQFCTAIRGSKRMKAFERLLQTLLREEGTTKIGETELECPSPMFNALFLTHHSLSHFMTEGIALRHLCDWAMLLHEKGDEMDWNAFCNHCREFGMRRFADSMTQLARRLLNVEIPAAYTPEENPEREEFLFSEMMSGCSGVGNEAPWKERLKIIGKILRNGGRHEMFSDEPYWRHIFRLFYGFCFDRQPGL